MHKLILVLLLLAMNGHAEQGDGLCSEETVIPGLPRVSCRLPSCTVGDCLPPIITRSSAKITWSQPRIQFSRNCPEWIQTGSCWEVRKAFRFELRATDPSGVAAIGPVIAIRLDTRPAEFRRFLKEARAAQNRYFIEDEVLYFAPMGARLDLEVFELCARDGARNEGCELPQLVVNPPSPPPPDDNEGPWAGRPSH